MRLLLDSRDLIDLVEHGRPVSGPNFGTYLRAGNHEIVLSFTNVRELAGPLAVVGDFLRIRPSLQALEQLPHTYIREAPIPCVEIQAALEAFNAGTEYQACNVYVNRWDETFVSPGQRSAVYDVVNLRLDTIVQDLFRVRPDIFAPPPAQHLHALREILGRDRDLHRTGCLDARDHFVAAIRNHSARGGLLLPAGREGEFAEWVHAAPHRCPGLRLQHQTYRELMANYGDIPEAADFSDLAHVCAVPYVDLATLDRRMRDYCRRASRTLAGLATPVSYDERLAQNVADIQRRYP